MKKTYIIPNTTSMVLCSHEHVLEASAHTSGAVDVSYGGISTGNMSSDVKRDDYNVWNDDWSN
jgi:hypothetical protein